MGIRIIESSIVILYHNCSPIYKIQQVPDTPVWLLSQEKEKEALKSLCYLRGWTAPENVHKEFEELVTYAKALNCCVICMHNNSGEIQEKGETECEHDQMNVIKRFVFIV